MRRFAPVSTSAAASAPAAPVPPAMPPASPLTAALLRHIGGVVRIIYLDRAGAVSQRCVRVDGLAGGKIRGYCLLRRGPRLFDPGRILAFEPVRWGRSRHG